MHRRAFIAFACGAAFTACPTALRAAADWASVKRTIRNRYPEVRQLSTDELYAILPSPDAPLLIDARSLPEYRVSHLKGARRAENASQAIEALADTRKDRPIVVYCSVGYRSAALAQELARRGYTRVANLEGSIFEWANKGYPVYRGSDRVRVVHPYDSSWGTLLEGRLWSTGQP